jgi:hypothetical protein
MSLPLITRIGWVCFALDALAVAMLFVTQNMGDDAAGRGMATGFAIILTPIVLGLGAGLLVAQRKGSRVGAAAATVMLGLPYLYAIKEMVMAPVSGIERAMYYSGFGRFDDPALTTLADAIEAGDLEAVRAAVSRGPVNWAGRDARGVTILGLAVHQATANEGVAADVDLVETLVMAGAPYRDDAIEAGGRMFSDIVYGAGDRVRLIDLLLMAGANPDDTERFDDRPLLIHHNMTVDKAKVLLAYGADLTGIRDTRSDRPGWDALMNVAYMQQWDLARFYLEQGCDPAYRAPDGRGVREVVAELRRDGLFDEAGAADDYRAFIAALDAR